jgi:hypothetical protein
VSLTSFDSTRFIFKALAATAAIHIVSDVRRGHQACAEENAARSLAFMKLGVMNGTLSHGTLFDRHRGSLSQFAGCRGRLLIVCLIVHHPGGCW